MDMMPLEADKRAGTAQDDSSVPLDSGDSEVRRAYLRAKARSGLSDSDWANLPPEERRQAVEAELLQLRKVRYEQQEEHRHRKHSMREAQRATSEFRKPVEHQPGFFVTSFGFENPFLSQANREDGEDEGGNPEWFRKLRPADLRGPLHQQSAWHGEFVRQPDPYYQPGDEVYFLTKTQDEQQRLREFASEARITREAMKKQEH